jgi:hypothetical protein
VLAVLAWDLLLWPEQHHPETWQRVSHVPSTDHHLSRGRQTLTTLGTVRASDRGQRLRPTARTGRPHDSGRKTHSAARVFPLRASRAGNQDGRHAHEHHARMATRSHLSSRRRPEPRVVLLVVLVRSQGVGSGGNRTLDGGLVAWRRSRPRRRAQVDQALCRRFGARPSPPCAVVLESKLGT